MFVPGFTYRVKRFIIHYVHFAEKNQTFTKTRKKMYFVFLNFPAFVIISLNSDYNFTHFSSF